jgi:hypothetical protein
MKASDLVTVWSAPDNSRLTTKQYSFRLPVHVAAKLAALEEIYPTKTRTQLVGDLLAAAIAEIERSLPTRAGPLWTTDPEVGELYVAEGVGVRYRELANKHHDAIERELGNDTPSQLFDDMLLVDKDGK